MARLSRILVNPLQSEEISAECLALSSHRRVDDFLSVPLQEAENLRVFPQNHRI
jgi:hypothetical protein